MHADTLTFRSRFPVNAADLFAWHSRPGAFERLRPPWERIDILERTGGIEDGARTVLRMPLLGPFHTQWVAEHRDYIAGQQFRDVQVRGPFAAWTHTHRFEPDGPDHAFLEDHLEYRLPLGAMGRLAGGRLIRHMLSRTFAYRHAITRRDLTMHADRPSPAPWKILVTGASGLIGANLVPFLTTGGHDVWRLARTPNPTTPATLAWQDLAAGKGLEALDGLDAVIHLAGEPIVGRWTRAKKERILRSRVDGTRHLCAMLAGLPTRPRTLVCASAIGYYGDRAGEVVDERSGPRTSFLSEVCREWEEAATPARAAGIRVVHLRIGVVLTPTGGALAAMLPVARAGLGGPIGSGEQYVSWVAMDDVIGAIHHALANENLVGPVNVVAPEPVHQADFARTLGRVLWRPAFVPTPAFILRLALGGMADALLLASTRVIPSRLRETGYPFFLPDLESALSFLLGRIRFPGNGLGVPAA